MTHTPFAPRCTKCGNACETSHYDPVPLKCPRGHRFEGSWPTHGESRSTVLSWRSLLRGDWRAVWLARGVGGPMVVDACPKCERPVTLDADTELSYGCTHCGKRSTISAGEGVLDLLPESTVHKPMWSFFNSEVTIGPFLHRGSASAVSCPSCGSPAGSVDGRGECDNCHTTLLALTSCGQRFVSGVRVTGVHEGTRLNGWMPVSEGLDYFERYRRYVRRSPIATLGAPVSVLVFVLCAPFWILLFVVGGLGAQFFDTLARFTGSEFLHSVSVAWIAGGFAGWATGFICIAVTGVGITALPILLNAIIRRRLGMHRPPKVHKLPQ